MTDLQRMLDAVPTAARLRCAGGIVYDLDLYRLPGTADAPKWVAFGPPMFVACAPFKLLVEPDCADVRAAVAMTGGVFAFIPVPPLFKEPPL